MFLFCSVFLLSHWEGRESGRVGMEGEGREDKAGGGMKEEKKFLKCRACCWVVVARVS